MTAASLHRRSVAATEKTHVVSGAPSGLEAAASPFTLLRPLADAASACGLPAAQTPVSRGLDGAEDAAGDGRTGAVLAADGTAVPASAERASCGRRTRNTISVGLTLSMRTVPPSCGRSVARPLAASYLTENGWAGMGAQ